MPIGGGATNTLSSNYCWGIALDDTSVYVSANVPAGGTIVGSVPLAGGQMTTLVGPESNALDIAVDDTNVYWSSNGAPGTIASVPLQGGTSVTLVQGTEPHYPVSDGTYLYWTDRDTWSSDAVFKLPLAGGSVVTVAPLQQGGASFLTLGTHDFFWAAGDDEGTIVKLPLE